MAREEFLNEVAKEYSKSVELINEKIKELRSMIEKLENQCPKCGGEASKDPYYRNCKKCGYQGPIITSQVKEEINLLKERLSPLLNIYRTTREIGREAANYYEGSWWRSEKYTCNSRKSRRPVICYGFIEEESDECKTDTKDEKNT